MAATLELSGGAHRYLIIPRGVLHGFVFHDPTLLLVGVTEYYDPTDDVGCLWSDPELGIDWPTPPSFVSERDRAAPPFRALLDELAPWQPFSRDGRGPEAASQQEPRIAAQLASR